MINSILSRSRRSPRLVLDTSLNDLSGTPPRFPAMISASVVVDQATASALVSKVPDFLTPWREISASHDFLRFLIGAMCRNPVVKLT